MAGKLQGKAEKQRRKMRQRPVGKRSSLARNLEGGQQGRAWRPEKGECLPGLMGETLIGCTRGEENPTGGGD